MYRRLYFVMAAGLALAACGNDSGTTTQSTSATTAPAEETMDHASALEMTPSDLSEELSRGTTLSADGTFLIVTGDFSNTSPGGTIGGAVFALAADSETGLAGKPVTVEIVSRGGPFRAAYSSRGAGNSGWKEFESSYDWETVSFTWDVPSLDLESNSDVIGIVPATITDPVEISSVKIYAAH